MLPLSFSEAPVVDVAAAISRTKKAAIGRTKTTLDPQDFIVLLVVRYCVLNMQWCFTLVKNIQNSVSSKSLPHLTSLYVTSR
mmetsp:Transcript_4263/g.9244  ORF Transcript_4263/g.9244 Transcript_4263/m.9244 type:complete len:82 (-) Transcript_4263:19-264(-)